MSRDARLRSLGYFLNFLDGFLLHFAEASRSSNGANCLYHGNSFCEVKHKISELHAHVATVFERVALIGKNIQKLYRLRRERVNSSRLFRCPTVSIGHVFRAFDKLRIHHSFQRVICLLEIFTVHIKYREVHHSIIQHAIANRIFRRAHLRTRNPSLALDLNQLIDVRDR